MKRLPGNIRQRIKRAVSELAENPRPPRSKVLSVPEFDGELRRLRLESWRIVYLVTEADSCLDVLAVRKRPPYNYDDLPELIAELL